MVEIPGRIIIDPGGPREYRCSFCGKSQHEVERLIAGPRGVYICNECVELCKEIISEEKPKAEPVETNEHPAAAPSGWRPTAPGQATANIIRAGHIEFLVTDLARAREFYVDLLGFVETEADDGHIYLRGLEERHHHSLMLTKADQPGVAHLAYRVATADDLDALAVMAEAHGLPHRWVEPGEEVGQGRALRMQDPGGIPTEFYADMVPAERLLQRFDLYRGAHIMRIDHFNLQVPDCQALTEWYMGTLGFRCSEYTGTEDDPERLWAAWLHRKGSVHDVAIMNGVGPRVHHGAWSLPDAMAVLRCCDVLAGANSADAIERGPGRHGIANALFLYLRDPDGNRVELYASDYLTVDPDFAPIRWTLNDPRRQTLWGHYVPRCWFEEAMRVQSITDHTFVPTHEPQMTSTPTYVH